VGKSEVLYEGKDVAILAVGSMVSACKEAYDTLKSWGINPTFVNVRFVKPLDTDLLDTLAKTHSLFVTVEENVKNGGLGEHVSAYMEACQPEVRVMNLAIWDRFVEQGKIDSLRAKIGLSSVEIAETVAAALEDKNR